MSVTHCVGVLVAECYFPTLRFKVDEERVLAVERCVAEFPEIHTMALSRDSFYLGGSVFHFAYSKLQRCHGDQISTKGTTSVVTSAGEDLYSTIICVGEIRRVPTTIHPHPGPWMHVPTPRHG